MKKKVLASVLGMIAIMMMGFYAMNHLRRTDAFVLGLEKIREDTRVAKALGEPYSASLFVGGNSSTRSGTTYVRMTFDLVGPSDSAMAVIRAYQDDSQTWKLTEITVSPKRSTVRRITVLDADN